MWLENVARAGYFFPCGQTGGRAGEAKKEEVAPAGCVGKQTATQANQGTGEQFKSVQSV